jgi:transcription-repair coupling factor (superfamily II helicase)
LPRLKQGIVIVPATALRQRLADSNYIDANTFILNAGDELDLELLRKQLINAGYYSVDQVMSCGEYAIRGGIVDIFPSGQDKPFRLDLFDTTIETIKWFNPENQRSEVAIDSIQLLPAREYPLDEDSISFFRQSFRATIDGDPRNALIYNEIKKGIIPSGTEFYLPLFFEQTASLFDYIPQEASIVLEEGTFDSLELLETETQDRYENAKLNKDWPPLEPKQLFLNVEQIREQLKPFARIELLNLNLKDQKHVIDFDLSPSPSLPVNARAPSPYDVLFNHLRSASHKQILIAESPGRREALHELCLQNKQTSETCSNWQQALDSSAKLILLEAPIDRGFVSNQDGIELITESQIYGERSSVRKRRSEKNRDPDAIIKSLAELSINDPVVHEDHGVGRYRGLQTLSVGGDDNEYMTVEYHGGDKIYVPVLSLEKVSRYVGGDAETAPLHKMGNDTWAKLTRKAKEKAYDVAAELLETQALRLSRKGVAFPEPDDTYASFAAGFGFEETADQQQVIDDVIADMVATKPMDRLVCGDVGFGKTEIALRAAFMAIAGNKQVVILVPTTLLAQQHYNQFADRFADWPVRVELFSRFRSSKDLDSAIKGIADGTVDIAIGTHKLLQKDIKFDNLGLMIIDEEHRFGVRQKEALKKLRSQVDILTLTATPIPRTLNFALSGLREISVIATPPKSRLSVKTFVREWSDSLIQEAITREIRRGGQVYFLHNDVQTMEKVQAQLADLVPEARIQIAHGQLPKRELEGIMREFYHQHFNVLLCSTIIESGIDVPTANTIIINKADRFGLAQLHQIRGRVGRSHHQAYAYLIAPPLAALTDDAQKRLTAIESLDTLGAGFALASQDLEIRGAGELLGESQSGTIDQVGYSLYSRYLEQAIESIKAKKRAKHGTNELNISLKPSVNTEINLNIPSRFPDEFIPDVPIRLTMYKRISGAANADDLKELKIETIDRFGLLPDAAQNLFQIAEVKLIAGRIGITEIEVGPKGGRLKFTDEPDINVENLMRLIAQNPKMYSMNGPAMLQISMEMPTSNERFSMLDSVLSKLSAE